MDVSIEDYAIALFEEKVRETEDTGKLIGALKQLAIFREPERERERINVKRFCGATVIGSRFGGSFRTNGSNKPYSQNHW